MGVPAVTEPAGAGGTNGPWFGCLPSIETSVPCGSGWHTIGWEAGSLRLPSHPDAEAEQVLAALGGERARCIELAEAWARHASDLSVLAIGPRGPDDEITVGWDDVVAAAQTGFGPRPVSMPGLAGQLPAGGRPGRAGAMARVTARQRQMQDEMRAAQRRRDDLVALLALGYEFQARLIGQVAAAHAGPGRVRGQAQHDSGQHDSGQHDSGQHDSGQHDSGQHDSGQHEPGQHEPGQLSQAQFDPGRPALVAAVAGRLAPVAERWLGIDPDQVVVTLHDGPGWGSAELTGREARRRLRVSLPAGWLASVWACGLALTGRHLVVAVEQPGWPQARVLGLRAPGAVPELLEVGQGADGTWNVRH
jgi:hypothetical protein